MRQQPKLKTVIDYEAMKVRARRAAEPVGISKQHSGHIMTAYRQRGIAAMAHRNRGSTCVNHIPEQVRLEILRWAKETHRDYNDCHLTEGPAEQSELILVSQLMLRRIRQAAGQGSPRRHWVPRTWQSTGALPTGWDEMARQTFNTFSIKLW
jgi:hypothetical protein